MDIMKRLPVFLVVMTLIVGSFFSAMHAHADVVSDSSGLHIVKTTDDNSDDGDTNLVECSQCCHAGSHIAFNNQSGGYNHNPSSSKHFLSYGESYLSQLNSPPFQPPRT